MYVELPDGTTAAAKEGFLARNEFTVMHFTMYTDASIRFLVASAGYQVLHQESIVEPSGKYTLLGFYSL